MHDDSEADELVILEEIREAENEADKILEKTSQECDKIIREARAGSSKLLAEGQEEIQNSFEKKIADFRTKSKVIFEEKISEGKNEAKSIRMKAEKTLGNAVDYIIKRFEEML